MLVSTHAPVMGATGALPHFSESNHVSTHAPVMGATLAVARGVRLAIVSTHAPVMGATRTRRKWGCQPCFNPRARDGRDAENLQVLNTLMEFQPTRP